MPLLKNLENQYLLYLLVASCFIPAKIRKIPPIGITQLFSDEIDSESLMKFNPKFMKYNPKIKYTKNNNPFALAIDKFIKISI